MAAIVGTANMSVPFRLIAEVATSSSACPGCSTRCQRRRALQHNADGNPGWFSMKAALPALSVGAMIAQPGGAPPS